MLLQKHRSVYTTWQCVDRYELLKYLEINIAMGIDERPSLKDYWSSCDFFQTPWYSKMLPRKTSSYSS